MQGFKTLLGELMDGSTHAEFSKETGLALSTISMLLSGERRPGRQTIRRLVERFPDRADALWRVFLSPDEHDCDDDSTEVISQGESEVPA
jgi:transcriptional regulator with XRE-family HTH domain